MIKVNLLKDAGNKQKKSDSTFADYSAKMPMAGNSALIKRVGFLLLPILLIYIYNWRTENGLKDNIANLTKNSATLDSQLEGLKPELDVMEQLKVTKNKISLEVNTIKELSKKRYFYAKILDSLQTLIPEKAWIIKLNVKDQVVSIEGRATEDSVISAFMQSLEESPYFSNVTWVDSREVTEPQGVVKSFNIRFNLENI
jgi:type IV pilus assembly protein PilN